MKPERYHPAMVAVPPSTNPPGTACYKCGHFACVCGIRQVHEEGCRFRIAATGAVGIACEHGRDCCPICDPCTCGQRITPL